VNLAVRSLGKAFGAQEVLADVTCDFPAGEISTVLGVSGSGKTTLLRIIAGLEPPDRGEVFLGNARITTARPQDRKMGLVFQDLALYPHLSVERNIILPLLAHGSNRQEASARARRIAAEFGLDRFLSRRAGSLSGGEAQRLALARSLVREPATILLDEPFSHLDAPLQRQARRFVFSTLRARRTTAVLVTHNHQDAQEAGGKVAFLEAGHIVQEGAWADLYRHPATPMVARVVSFLEPIELRGEIRSDDGLPAFECQDLGLRIDLKGQESVTAPAGLQAALVLLRPEDLTARAGTGACSRQLHGEVVSTFMSGPVVFYRLRHASGLMFAARAPEPAQPVGARLGVDLGSAPKVVFSCAGLRRCGSEVGAASCSGEERPRLIENGDVPATLDNGNSESSNRRDNNA